MKNVAIIGMGKMGTTLARAILRAGLCNENTLWGIGDEIRQKQFVEKHPEAPFSWARSINHLPQTPDIILICVKPQQIDEVLQDLKLCSPTVLFISIAAGISIGYLESRLPARSRIIRTMPNTPLFLGKGVTGYTMNPCCHGDDRLFVEKLFGSVGSTYQLPEELLNALTALSGSGPAYFYELINYFSDAAVQHGFNKEEAIKIMAETALGAAEMLLHTRLTPEELISQVRSKGGTTEAGLEVLSNSPAREAIENTVAAATARAEALGNRE